MKNYSINDFYTPFMFVNKHDRNADLMNNHNLRLRRESAEKRRSHRFVRSTRCKNPVLFK
jgi:hypothetical protein